MVTDTFTINVHALVVVYMYLVFIMTGRNICNDGDKGVQICISPTFIAMNLERLSGNKSLVCINAECKLETLTVALTGAADIFVNWRVRR